MDEPRAELVRMGGHGRRHFRIRENDGLAGAHDAGFLVTDGLDIVAQPFAMVERHIGDQRRIGIHDIHGVEAAAQADLENRRIDVRGLEHGKRRERAELEVGQTGIAPRRLDALERGDDLFVRREQAIDGDAFVVTNDVRRGVCADDIVAGQQRAQHLDARSPCRWSRPRE